MTLQGASGLKARLRAIRRTVAVANRAWGKETREQLAVHTPQRSGKTRKSYKIRASQKRGAVYGSFVAYFIDAGVVQHPIKAKKASTLAFPVQGRTVFARKVNHPGYGARPFRAAAAEEGLRRTDPIGTVIGLWNAAD